jgi:Asp-tRNA(Asn)/Glu-tRNA(Gln) amidotransferase A subunit family amidase
VTEPHDPSRRSFLASTGAFAALSAAAALPGAAQEAAPPQRPSPMPPQAGEQPETIEAPAPGTPSGLSTQTVAEAERLAGVQYTPAEREMIVESIGEHLERLRQRQSMPLPAHHEPPALIFDPRLPGMSFPHLDDRYVTATPAAGRPPNDDEAIAYAPLTVLSHWIERRMITSQRLTRIYHKRLRELGPRLECVITLLDEDKAMEKARAADIDIATGRYRGPLHGIPWGAKDLLDTEGLATTWGAEPYRHRVPRTSAHVVKRLEDAGAVLIAKLTLGALAYNDIWFGGRTRNPWNLERGSSGSSAGSAAAIAAGLVGFTLGTETYGSIVSPCMRCGATGLRPTFGRVGRSGAMPLCWSLDKIGPICRTVEDCMMVLRAINGWDPGDPASLEMPLSFDATAPVEGMRLGLAPRWFKDRGAKDLDRKVMEVAQSLGLQLFEIDLPEWPYDILLNNLYAEATASFEELTRSNRDDELSWQDKDAWPNSFRRSWFIPAVEQVQIDRFRRKVMTMMDERFADVDAIISPSFAGSMLLITNFTGHPSLTIRTGFLDEQTPHGITIWGRLFDEGTLCRIGMALEKALGVWDKRPPLMRQEERS